MGRQWANDSMTPEPIGISRDAFGNEWAKDRPMHADTTAGEGTTNFDDATGQYSQDWKGGFRSYGKSVSAPEISRSSVVVDNNAANRGPES